MHNIQTHQVINHYISFFYRIGFWHRGDKPTVKELGMKWFYCIYFFLFFASLSGGVISNIYQSKTVNSIHQSMFTATVAVIVGVLQFKFHVFIWQQEKVLELLNCISNYSMRNEDTFVICNNKTEKLMKLAAAFTASTFVAGIFAVLVEPILGTGKTLTYILAFPLDWRNDDFAYFLANVFIVTEAFLTNMTILFTVIHWYLMIQCSFRYEGLAGDLKIMGRRTEVPKKPKMSEKERQNVFLQDLKDSIVAHTTIRGLIDEFEILSSNIFLIQFCTSGACICTSTYCLAFIDAIDANMTTGTSFRQIEVTCGTSLKILIVLLRIETNLLTHLKLFSNKDIGENNVERLINLYMFGYNIAELFMITYFGNEIMLSSSGISYSLFESDWFEQPLSTNKYIIVFGEYLRQPHVLLVGKLFPLNLETFNRILHSAYSMFNILKGTQQ